MTGDLTNINIERKRRFISSTRKKMIVTQKDYGIMHTNTTGDNRQGFVALL